MKKPSVILFLVFMHTLSLYAQKTVLSLSQADWNFRQSGTEKWLTAKVPGCVHDDLLTHGLIPDPFYACGEDEVRWVDSADWEYRCVFRLDPKTKEADHLELVFDGLDTYSEVFLNGHLMGHSSNMFVPLKFDIKPWIIEGENEIFVLFRSASRMARQAYDSLPLPLPYDERLMVRKAPYQFGWDWAPRMTGCGIWRDCSLLAWDDVLIEDFYVVPLTWNEKEAELVFEACVKTSGIKGLMATCYIDGQEAGQQKIAPEPGMHEIRGSISIKKPELWWPLGMGKAHLYRAEIVISDKKHAALDSASLMVGIRRIELVREKDSAGQSFLFRINGKPLFIKGANYIPRDVFPSRYNQATTSQLVDAAAECHMNMLRIWGGGVYEDEAFYSLCDEKGILVWQDFMFACAMPPGDEQFRQNVREEVKAQVIRLRKHPCIALWCGNNEIDEGWKNWGMQKQFAYGPEDSARIWNDYLRIFHEDVPELLRQLDTSRDYHPSSPLHGWGREESMNSGDAHYWGVWWGDREFEVLNSKVPRFMSEFGFQALPQFQTLSDVIPDESLRLESPELLCHQKHPRGFELIRNAMLRDFWVPEKFEDYLIMSQFVQARALQTGIEAQRRSRPWCMGSLYWQFNDCWPVISWSTLDYEGRWKAGQYAVKRAYLPVILSAQTENQEIHVYGINDLEQNIEGELKIRVMDTGGLLIWQKSIPAGIQGNTARELFSMKFDRIGFLDTTTSVFSADLMDGDSLIASCLKLLCRPVDFKHPEAGISMSVKRADSSLMTVTLRSKVPVVGASLQADEDVHFSDNFFDLLPGRETIVEVRPLRGAVLSPDTRIRVRSLHQLR